MDPLQRRIHEITLGLGRTAVARAGSVAPGPSRGHRPGASATDLPQLLASRLRTLGDDDPQRRGKAMRVFLESVLTAEMGEAFMASPQFTTVVDRVQRQMEQDAELAPLIEQAMDDLLARRAP